MKEKVKKNELNYHIVINAPEIQGLKQLENIIKNIPIAINKGITS
jgi:hypothetical protein